MDQCVSQIKKKKKSDDFYQVFFFMCKKFKGMTCQRIYVNKYVIDFIILKSKKHFLKDFSLGKSCHFWFEQFQ